MHTAPTAITFPYVLVGKRVWVSPTGSSFSAAIANVLRDEGAETVLSDCKQPAVSDFKQVDVQTVVLIAGRSPNDLEIIQRAHASRVQKLVYVVPAANLYPSDAPQPLMEIFFEPDRVIEGSSDQDRAVAQAVKLCSELRRDASADYFSCLHAELYGPGMEPTSSVTQLITSAKRDGRRGLQDTLNDMTHSHRHELLHTDDAASAVVHLLQNYTGEMHVNVGAGFDVSNHELASIVASIARVEDGQTLLDRKPGTLPRLLNTRRLAATGWRPRIGLREGVAETYGSVQ
jgi:GDP-L-fucose synthase